MHFRVDSEVGQLRQAIIHRPGLELSRLTPDNIGALLFDDVMWAPRPRRNTMPSPRPSGTRGYTSTTTASCWPRRLSCPKDGASSSTASAPPRSSALRWSGRCGGCSRTWTAPLAEFLVGGVLKADLHPLRAHSLKWDMLKADDFVLAPLPNHLFQRDNSCWIYGGVTINPMAMPARQRESLHTRAIYRFHPLFAGADFVTYYGDEDRNYQPATIEGGDVHVIGHGAVLIGMGERTTPMAIETVAHALFAAGQADHGGGHRAPPQPRLHAPRHGDVHGRRGHLRPLPLLRPPPAQLDRHGRREPGRAHHRPQPQPVGHPGRDPGGHEITVLTTDEDIRAAEREQWDDGTNYLAVAPGVVMGYERNVATNTMLRKHGHRGGDHRRQRARPGPGRPALHDLSHPTRPGIAGRTTEGPTMNLHGRSLLKEIDFTKEEFLFLVDLAEELRQEKRRGTERQRMVGRNIALIFEKASTRTRSAFEVGAHDQGAHVTYLGPEESHIGHEESIEGHRPGARPDVRRHRVPGLLPRTPSRRWADSPGCRCGTG